MIGTVATFCIYMLGFDNEFDATYFLNQFKLFRRAEKLSYFVDVYWYRRKDFESYINCLRALGISNYILKHRLSRNNYYQNHRWRWHRLMLTNLLKVSSDD